MLSTLYNAPQQLHTLKLNNTADQEHANNPSKIFLYTSLLQFLIFQIKMACYN